jgi:N-acetylglutamate synthase-like GNAT family acetyltransferase
MNWKLRVAREDDAPALEALIPVSVHALQARFYSGAQMEAALGPVFGVDRQLIRDGTYFVAETCGAIVGCGGWSKRPALFGGDSGRRGEEPGLLDPRRDAARVRAFFVHPDWVRRGIGRGVLEACEAAIREAGFERVELVATLAGETLYRSCGYKELRRHELPLPNGLNLPVVTMGKVMYLPAT